MPRTDLGIIRGVPVMGLHPVAAVLDPDLVCRELVALDPVLMVLMDAEVVVLGEAREADLEGQALVLAVRHVMETGPKGAGTVVLAQVQVADLKGGGIVVLIEAHPLAISSAAMIAAGTTTTGAKEDDLKVGVRTVVVAMARRRVKAGRMPKSLTT